MPHNNANLRGGMEEVLRGGRAPDHLTRASQVVGLRFGYHVAGNFTVDHSKSAVCEPALTVQ